MSKVTIYLIFLLYFMLFTSFTTLPTLISISESSGSHWHGNQTVCHNITIGAKPTLSLHAWFRANIILKYRYDKKKENKYVSIHFIYLRIIIERNRHYHCLSTNTHSISQRNEMNLNGISLVSIGSNPPIQNEHIST